MKPLAAMNAVNFQQSNGQTPELAKLKYAELKKELYKLKVLKRMNRGLTEAEIWYQENLLNEIGRRF